MDTHTLIRLPAVMQRTGLKRAWIYALIREGKFPKQVKIGVRASAWIEQEVVDWVATRIGTSRAGSEGA